MPAAPARGGGLFRAATISTVPSIGAENSEGYGGSPLVQTLRSAWTYAPTPGKVQGQGGGWRDESISGCGLARDHPPLARAVHNPFQKAKMLHLFFHTGAHGLLISRSYERVMPARFA